MPDPPAEVYGAKAAEYAEATSLDGLPEDFVALLESFAEAVPGERILDAGCGPGRDCEFFHDRGLSPVGVDLAAGMLEYARANRPGRYLQMDIRYLGLPDDHFAAVWCPASVFFLDSAGIDTALAEFERVLRPDGIARIGFKLGDGRTVVEKWDTAMREYHVTESEARQRLRSAGLAVESVRVDEVASGVTFASCRCEPAGAEQH
ncbi:class I SAM-dependent methyltransferase [Halobacteriales archaeon Cl-PHB]